MGAKSAADIPSAAAWHAEEAVVTFHGKTCLRHRKQGRETGPGCTLTVSTMAVDAENSVSCKFVSKRTTKTPTCVFMLHHLILIVQLPERKLTLFKVLFLSVHSAITKTDPEPTDKSQIGPAR